MLYKKYHRNFVKQFKKEARIGFRYRDRGGASALVDVVKIEPCVDMESQIDCYDGIFKGIRMTGIYYDWVLVYPSGYINHDVKAIEDAV